MEKERRITAPEGCEIDKVKLLYIDLFCGAGGTTTGIEKARIHGAKCAKVIACVNHDANAIASHAANHPEAMHFTEDIRTLDITPLAAHLTSCRNKFPDAKVVLWASLECTNFSKAKGGQPREADSRTLANHLFRYIEAINPDYIQIENVVEFMSWGEIDENGKPISRDKGRCFIKWVNGVKKYGYNEDHRILNAADFGAYTSRKRLFMIFAKKGLPIVYPFADYAREGASIGLFDETIHRWKPVRDVLDLNDVGTSIFIRSKPLCEKTLERIYAGLLKFVAGGKDSLHFSGAPDSKNQSLERPAGSVTCKDHHSFLTAFYGNGFNRSVMEPAPIVMSKDHFSLVTTKFYQNEYSGGGQISSIDEPNPAVMTTPKQKLVTVKQYLMNPQFRSAGGSIDTPCFTLIARMDKMPPYLVTTKEGRTGIAIYGDDSPMTRKIKEFMALYGIIDICMRMLKVSELKRIMGFPDNYVLVGTQSEQKKFIGNAVEVNMSRRLCEALAEAN